MSFSPFLANGVGEKLLVSRHFLAKSKVARNKSLAHKGFGS